MKNNSPIRQIAEEIVECNTVIDKNNCGTIETAHVLGIAIGKRRAYERVLFMLTGSIAHEPHLKSES